MKLRSIDTRYAGRKFRSRLEARWAVFFDAWGVRWDYEPQGFDLGGLWYLPDFWMPQWRTWIEIKPSVFDVLDAEKCMRLAVASKCKVTLLAGTPYATWGRRDYDGIVWDPLDEADQMTPLCGVRGFKFSDDRRTDARWLATDDYYAVAYRVDPDVDYGPATGDKFPDEGHRVFACLRRASEARFETFGP